MGTSEVDTDQKDLYCNCCSGKDAILVYFGSRVDAPVPWHPIAATPHQSELFYTMITFIIFFKVTVFLEMFV